MKGVNQVPDFLDEIGAILDYEADFTERDPVYLIDPTGSEFGIEMAGTIAAVPRLHVEPVLEQSPVRDPLMFVRRIVNRTVALRLNPIIDRINESVGLRVGALAESLRRLATSHRNLEDRVAALSRERRAPTGSSKDRITALEQKLRLLELNVVALEDAISELESKNQDRGGTEPSDAPSE
jgi:hypothetical protein